jgi:hypothetical protein
MPHDELRPEVYRSDCWSLTSDAVPHVTRCLDRLDYRNYIKSLSKRCMVHMRIIHYLTASLAVNSHAYRVIDQAKQSQTTSNQTNAGARSIKCHSRHHPPISAHEPCGCCASQARCWAAHSCCYTKQPYVPNMTWHCSKASSSSCCTYTCFASGGASVCPGH